MFKDFKTAVQRQFNLMKKSDLFRVDVDKDKLWEKYLSSFPEGTNPIFRERTEHDCQACRSFVRNAGSMITLVDGKVVSIWDVKVDGCYQVVADELSKFVKGFAIDNLFLHPESSIGVDKNFQQTDDGVLTWEHFFIQLPTEVICKGDLIGTKLSDYRSTRDVMFRGLSEITVESLDTVLELINQNSLYRGEESKHSVTSFSKLKNEFDKLLDFTDKQDKFCWSKVKSISAGIARLRNSAIGTLLVDLSEGKDLENAVASFEAKVAPQNYQRPTSLVTKGMIEKAKAKVEELGLTSALERRFAILEDITINNILFADRAVKAKMDNVFDEIAAGKPAKVKKLDKVEEVTIDQFIKNILPNAESIEVLLENRHESNLVSLIAPVDLTAKGMFKWNNTFSWSYAGGLADSIKERVKKAGGNVTGDVCCRIAWYNKDDLDLHMHEPGGGHIYYPNRRKKSHCGGVLDVDANGMDGVRSDPCENIFYEDMKKMKEGEYILRVNNYQKRENSNFGFDIEIDVQGTVHKFSYAKGLSEGETLDIARITYSKKDGITIVPFLLSSQSVKEIWGIPTQTYHKASVIMLSPNYWDEQTVGNKHYFFMLEGCLNDDQARGFLNEYLTTELTTHRKVLEIVGSKMQTEKSQNQLSGLGFSSTKRDTLLCKVKGSFTRTIKIVF